MAGALDGRVAVITGAGRGLGREHALLFAAEGAKVVVNDLGAEPDGNGSAHGPAQEVADQIRATGGAALVNGDDVSDFDGAGRLIEAAVDAFGDVDILVNNAGILRDRFLVNMSESEWDDVIRVHLKGHFAPTQHVAALWRARSKAGVERPRAIVNTSSGSGLFGNPGQTNYAAAKAGIAAMAMVWAKELERYGARVNAVAPVARTRLTEQTPGLSDTLQPPSDDRFDLWSPANIAPLVAYLASERCPFNGHVFYVQGGQVALMRGFGVNHLVSRTERWSVDGLADALSPFAGEQALGDWDALREYRAPAAA